MLIAQAVHLWSIADWAIFCVVIAILVGIVLIVLKATNTQLPAWAWQIAGLVVLAVVAILAIRFVSTL